MKRIFIVAAMAALLTGCNEKIEVDTLEYGTINPVLSSDVEVSVSTKATTELTANEAANYNLKIVSSSTGVDFNCIYQEFIPTTPYPAAEDYTMYAESCTEGDAAPSGENGCARFAGSQDFIVEANKATPVTVACTMANSKAGVVFDASFTSAFTEHKVELTVGERSAEYSANTTDDNAFYFNIPAGGATIEYTISGKFSGTDKLYTGEVSGVEAAKYVKLTIKADTSNGTIGAPTITVDKACDDDPRDVVVNPYNPYNN